MAAFVLACAGIPAEIVPFVLPRRNAKGSRCQLAGVTREKDRRGLFEGAVPASALWRRRQANARNEAHVSRLHRCASKSGLSAPEATAPCALVAAGAPRTCLSLPGDVLIRFASCNDALF
jgi:hypothetical protein